MNEPDFNIEIPKELGYINPNKKIKQKSHTYLHSHTAVSLSDYRFGEE